MARYLRCTVTGDVVSACYLYDRDAATAAGASELLELAAWMSDKAEFPRRHGIRREVVRDLSWPTASGIRLRLLERAFHDACAPR